MAAADRTERRRCWEERELMYFLSSQFIFPIAQTVFIYIYIFQPHFFKFDVINFSCSHACRITSSGAPVVYSSFFGFYNLYFSKIITLGSVTLCHHHHWCYCWDISLCLNPPPSPVSSRCNFAFHPPPSLSENLSCPLMGVCWWVSLIVWVVVLQYVILCLQ